MYELSSDETVSSFLEYAASLNYPSIIYVCVVNSNVETSSLDSEYQPTTFDFVSEQTYGSHEPDFVSETLQSVQEDDDDDDDDDDVDVDDVVDDNHVFHLGIAGIDSDEEAIPETPSIISYGVINDFHRMPPPLPDVEEEAVVTDEGLSYIRSLAISEADVF